MALEQMKSIYNILLEWGEKNPQFEFIDYKKKYTINNILCEIESISKSLKYIPDSNIGIYLKSPSDIMLIYLSCIKENKIPIIFSSRWSKFDIDSAIDKYKIEHIISEWSNKSYNKKNTNIYYFEELINSSRGCAIIESKYIERDYESILFTSGTTGFSKAVCLKRENFFHSAKSWNDRINFSPQDKYIMLLPMHHISGLSILYRAIYYNFKINIIDNYKEINGTDGTIISLVPSLLERMLDERNYVNALKSLRAIIIGGEKASNNLLERCLDNNLNVFVSYGMTETCSGISGYWIKDSPKHLGSSGLPFNGVKISITNNNISIDSQMNMHGYYKENKLTNPFISNDIGYIENDYLFVTGREGTMFTGGEKVNTDYVKSVLLKNKNIKSVNIKVNKDKTWGNSLIAEIKTENIILSEAELIDWCKDRLPMYAVPKKINFR